MSNNFYTDDIQTGRNVYVDKDLYESDESYKARIDSYVKEGFALVFGTPDNPSSGGGGSSDFSTATLTIINNSNFAVYGAPIVCPLPDIIPPIEVIMGDDISNGEHDVVLYKGNATVNVDYDSSLTTEITTIGAIEKLTEEEGHILYKITGDCTITDGTGGGGGDVTN